ncbi:hypothetical protein MTBUT4_20058 [Magnetospirillum sp. UT-4]|nr:hypothetical protein MTBUT4_20058 [Magnetospirillum sp. UT-4]
MAGAAAPPGRGVPRGAVRGGAGLRRRARPGAGGAGGGDRGGAGGDRAGGAGPAAGGGGGNRGPGGGRLRPRTDGPGGIVRPEGYCLTAGVSAFFSSTFFSTFFSTCFLAGPVVSTALTACSVLASTAFSATAAGWAGWAGTAGAAVWASAATGSSEVATRMAARVRVTRMEVIPFALVRERVSPFDGGHHPNARWRH